MTAPVTTEALVEALAAWIGTRQPITQWQADAQAKALVAGPLASLLAAHQQVTAARDEDRAELARLRAEGEDLRAYAKKVGTTLVRLTCDGSEFYTRAGEDFRVDADACDAWFRRSRQSKHDMIVRLTEEVSALRAEGEAKDRALKAATDKLEAVCSAISVAAEWERAAERSAQREDERLRRNPLIRGAVEAARAATAREGA